MDSSLWIQNTEHNLFGIPLSGTLNRSVLKSFNNDSCNNIGLLELHSSARLCLARRAVCL